jgi:hypothetical protein
VVRALGPTTVSATTDATGAYVLTNLVAGGMYVVCEDVKSGWVQVSPTFANPCPSGMGYNFSVDAGGDSFVNFGNMLQL